MGTWSGRSVTSDEASKWLGELLTLCSSELEKVTSHSLKATTLSWLAKAGSDENHRTILGHHSTGKKSLEIYSRDLLSAPLRTLEDVLRQVRVGSLRPDLTRSGHIQDPMHQDCKEAEGGDGALATSANADEDSDSSSSTSSSSSSAEDSEADETSAQHWTSLGAADPCALQSSWGTHTMYQHETSKIVHVEADSELRLFKCGVKATSEHHVIQSTAFLENRKCKRCLRVLDASE
jgi:hypothetical protein